MSKNKSNRSAGREFSFQYLYHLQLTHSQNDLASLVSNKESIISYIEEDLEEYRQTIPTQLDSNSLFFAIQLIKGTLQNHNELMEEIEKFATKSNHISKIDLTILLPSVYELLNLKETPTSVVINEAIEIAKKYGNEKSKNFINGILDKMATEYGRK